MAETTSIEWAQATFNPWIGCTRVSPACDDCYAARSTPARALGVQWGAGQERRRTSESNWLQPLRWNRKAGVNRERWRVFCASLADWLDNEVPAEWLADLLDVIRLTPNLDWLLLSKRIGNWRTRLMAAKATLGPERVDLFGWIDEWLLGRPPENVWVGETIINQEEAERDIGKLVAVPARVRFLSIEPMLGPMNLLKLNADARPVLADIDWVIAGGESGPRARPAHPDWFKSLRDQCAAAGVPFLMKQHGEWAADPMNDTAPIVWMTPDGLVEEHPRNNGKVWTQLRRLGKKAAGRLLDGVEHNEFPK